MMGLQWHQLEYTHIICTSIQKDTDANTSSLSFYTGCSSYHPANSVKALKAKNKRPNKMLPNFHKTRVSSSTNRTFRMIITIQLCYCRSWHSSTDATLLMKETRRYQHGILLSNSRTYFYKSFKLIKLQTVDVTHLYTHTCIQYGKHGTCDLQWLLIQPYLNYHLTDGHTILRSNEISTTALM